MPSGDADTAAAAMASHADVVSSELTLPIYAEESTRGDALALAALRMEIDGPKNYVSMWGKGDVGAKAHPEARIGAGVPIRSGGIGAAHAGNGIHAGAFLARHHCNAQEHDERGGAAHHSGRGCLGRGAEDFVVRPKDWVSRPGHPVSRQTDKPLSGGGEYSGTGGVENKLC